MLGYIRAFAQQMRAMRGHLVQAGKLQYKYQKQRWFLEAADIYCDAVNRLTRDLVLQPAVARLPGLPRVSDDLHPVRPFYVAAR